MAAPTAQFKWPYGRRYMPHLIIEYAKPLAQDTDIQGLVDAVFDAAPASELFDPKAIKVRATGIDAYSTAGTDQAFIHVDIKLLPGRSSEQKKALSERVLDKVLSIVSDTVAVSVEINILDKDTYSKRV